ncbi:energy transducer TonB [Edaphobacter bradus]|uniref:energy transducer TonB n=1 Tax=Edaphobacter bradus TaxID=2259016 RepID=UPI0021E0BF13|nr:energy transducer TonB [Edaphobacter bradus]
MAAPNVAPAASHTSLLSLHGRIAAPGPEPALSNHDSMSDNTALPDALTASSRSPSVTVTPPHSDKPLPISGGVSAGMLLNPIRPIYPAIARAARVEGTVVVDAVISRTGTIESLRVIRGPAVLQQAAIDAIKAARYQPYRLNGEPTDVQTTITVNFRLEN